jgi:negative regulator of sigma E activity
MGEAMEGVSRLFDGDLDPRDARPVVRSFDEHDAETARDAWTSYALIGDALRGNSTPDDGFTARILARLRSELDRR